MRRIAIAFALLLSVPLGAAMREPIAVDGGSIAGIPGWGWGVRAYLGVPFAAPPVGNLRWKEPQPVVPWQGVRMADRFGNSCMQRAYSANRGSWNGADDGRTRALIRLSEDCLYLNVWTSATSVNDKRPVMLWIYGGGFTGGSGGMAWYDGENLAAKGPVIVTINYRLGSLGFFAHPALAKEAGHPGSGNYGMMDAIAALQWVKRNIAAFGGDPSKVTVAGESAGAIMVGALVGSPQAKGLFTRAIAESGGWMGLTMARMRTSADAEAGGAKAVEALGVKTIAELRAKPMDQLTGLQSAGLVVDGYVIPEDVSLTFASGKQNAVDVLTGSNKDEANFGICGPGAGVAGRGGAGMTAATFKSNAERKFGEMTDQYLRLYPAATDADAQRAAHEACADEITWNMRQWAAAEAAKGKKAYTYLFSHVQTVNGQPSPQGATHTAEISFAWNNPKGQATQTWNDVDVKLADQMSSYWVNFIAKGDPNGPGLPHWPEFKSLSKDRVMVFADTPQVEPAAPAPKLAFYAAAFQHLMKGATN